MDLAVVEWAGRDRARYIPRIELGAREARVRVLDESDDRWFGPLPYGFDEGRQALVENLLRPAGLTAPKQWVVPQWIPSPGGEHGWHTYWASLLIDIANYGWVLREEPDGLRCELIELTHRGEALITVTGSGCRWVTALRIPPAMEFVGVPFDIRDWVFERSGQQLEDDSWFKRVRR